MTEHFNKHSARTSVSLRYQHNNPQKQTHITASVLTASYPRFSASND